MADNPETNDGADNGSAEGGDQPARPQLRTLAQFIKDLSFELPDGADALRNTGEGGNLSVSVNVDAAKRAEDVYETAIKIEAKAETKERVVYNLELVYAGLFALKDVPEQMIHPALYIDCPALLFPFVRRLVADLTRESGLAPLFLDPIDFGNLYRQKAEQIKAQQGAAADS